MKFVFNIKKKDLWLLSAIVVFIVGVGFVIAYDSGGPASVMGHSADELEGVCLSDGTNCPEGLGGGGGSYDSGWFAIANGQNIVLDHNLGTTALVYKVYAATSSAGANMMEVNDVEWTEDYYRTTGYSMQEITTNSFKLITATSGYSYMNDAGNAQSPSSSRAWTWARIIAGTSLGSSGGGGFGQPVWDSGWISYSAGSSQIHNFPEVTGASADDLFVDIQVMVDGSWGAASGISNQMTAYDGQGYGLTYGGLTTNSIEIYQGSNPGTSILQYRVRVWGTV